MEHNKISTFKATAMSVNLMIGAGILAGPGIMASVAGGASFFGWILVSALMFPMVYNISRLPEAIHGSGGIYLYCKESLGQFGGFIGGTLYFLSYNFAMTTVLVTFWNTFSVWYPDLWILQSRSIFLLICLSLIFALNLLPASLAATIQSTLVFAKLAPILIAICLAPFFLKFNGFQISVFDLTSVFKTIPMAMFGFLGYEYSCNISHMVGEPKNAKFAILSSFAFVTVLYTVFHFCVLSIMGPAGLATFQASGYASFVAERFPTIASALMIILPVSTVVTFLNGSNGIMFLDSIILNSMASDNMFRSSNILLKLNKYSRPWICALITLIFSVFFGTIVEKTEFLAISSNLCVMILLIISTTALIKIDLDRPFGFNKTMCYLGIFTSCGLTFLNWLRLGSSTHERLISLIPLFIGVGLSIMLFNPKAILKNNDKIGQQ